MISLYNTCVNLEDGWYSVCTSEVGWYSCTGEHLKVGWQLCTCISSFIDHVHSTC